MPSKERTHDLNCDYLVKMLNVLSGTESNKTKNSFYFLVCEISPSLGFSFSYLTHKYLSNIYLPKTFSSFYAIPLECSGLLKQI